MTESISDYSSGRLVYSVTRLNQEVKQLLEISFPAIWVEGEISNFSRPASGHWYFTLKDNGAQLRCAMFRGNNRRCGIEPREGLQVQVRGRLTLYPVRGEYQLVVDTLEDAGEGALQRAFEALRKKLQSEGLFDTERKQPIPAMPRRIVVITSATGAAIRDVLSVLQRRFPICEVVVYPVLVQGDAAAPAIVNALATASRRADGDVVLLVRGGGSLEDLWAFNEESVARAIADCAIPVVSGVGHETDTTIADMVADRRAATPSAAAEMVVPDGRDWLDKLSRYQRQLLQSIQRMTQSAGTQLSGLNARLSRSHPRRQLEVRNQRLDELQQRLARQMGADLSKSGRRVENLGHRVLQTSPAYRLERDRRQLTALQLALKKSIAMPLTRARHQLALHGSALQQLSPLTVLSRGYAVARDAQGRLLRAAAEVNPGDPVSVLLKEGRLECSVTATHDDNISPFEPSDSGDTR